jgi:hypothetical protein
VQLARPTNRSVARERVRRHRFALPSLSRLVHRHRVVTAAVALVVVAGFAGLWSVTRGHPSPHIRRVVFPGGFAGSSAFSEPVSDVDAERASASTSDDQVVDALSRQASSAAINTGPFATAIYIASAATPRYKLSITHEGVAGPGAWGDNALAHVSVPIPRGLVAPSGSDHKVVILDRSTGNAYDLWELHRTQTSWSIGWGGVYPLSGDGASANASGSAGGSVSRGTGSGISSLAGVITVEDIKSGVIDHALAFSSDLTCSASSSAPFVSPATTTDGVVSGPVCLPEGDRVMLDRRVDLAALHLNSTEMMVARALQRYGAYCVDSGGAALGFAAQLAVTPAQKAVYGGAGMAQQYTSLAGIDWRDLRIVPGPAGNR